MFQSESRKSGDAFEDMVEADLSRTGIKKMHKNVILTDIGVEADFAYKDIIGRQFYVEAKGGEATGNKRPGARRTDNVKKAIANGALIKASYPEAHFVVYFSELPKHGSASHKMLKKATQAGYIDAIRYLIKVQ